MNAAKVRGNEAFRQGNFEDAVNAYTAGLVGDLDIDELLLLNRANCYLRMERFDDALVDLTNLETRSQCNAKLYYRLALAHAGLRDFEQAKSYFELAVSLEASAGLLKLRNVLATRLEEHNGGYDWTRICSSQSMSQGNLPIADFCHPSLRVENSAGKGRGVFTTEFIPAGTLIMVEKAFAFVQQRDKSGSACLFDLVMNRMSKNPSLQPAILDLFSGTDGMFPKGKGTIDEHKSRMVSGILQHNSFGSSQSMSTGSSQSIGTSGIWRKASYLNHSCVSNAHRHFVADVIVITAKQDIEASQEIHISYITVGEDYDTRKQITKGFGFACGCQLCELDSKTNIGSRRRTLLAEYTRTLLSSFRERQNLSRHELIELKDAVEAVVNNIEVDYLATGRSCYWYDLSSPAPVLGVLQMELGLYEAAARTWKLLIAHCNDQEESSVGLYTMLAQSQFHSGGTEAELAWTMAGIARAWAVTGKVPSFVGYWHEYADGWLECPEIERKLSAAFDTFQASLQARTSS